MGTAIALNPLCQQPTLLKLSLLFFYWVEAFALQVPLKYILLGQVPAHNDLFLHSSAMQHTPHQSTVKALSQTVGTPSQLPHTPGHPPLSTSSRGSEQLYPVQSSLHPPLSLLLAAEERINFSNGE